MDYFYYQQDVKFPAVTICNQNAIKNDEIPADLIDNIYKDIFEVLDEENKSDDKDTGNGRCFLCLYIVILYVELMNTVQSSVVTCFYFGFSHFFLSYSFFFPFSKFISHIFSF